MTIKEVSQAPHGTVEINSDGTNTKIYSRTITIMESIALLIPRRIRDGSTDTAVVEVKITPHKRSAGICFNSDYTAILGTLYKYDVNAVDPDGGDKLTYSLVSKPEGMTINANTGVIEWTPDDIIDNGQMKLK